MPVPGGVTNLQHTFTIDSLTFTWDAATDADQYRATLYRDDVLVEEQVVTTLTATFSTLEDGTEYLLAIRAENAQGSGPTNYDLATTGYFVPVTPTNFHELSTRIIAIEPAWDLAEPTKVLQVRVQVLIGSDILYDEVLTEVGTTSRLFPVPMASTDYFVRIQAGNPAGWSGWLEGTASTLVYPLIDTRLAVMAAAYQEDVLHTDTWDGSTDLLKGVVEAIKADAGVVVGGYGLEQTYFPPATLNVSRASREDSAGLHPVVTMTAAERPIQQFFTQNDLTGITPLVDMTASEKLMLKRFAPDESVGLLPSLAMVANEAQKQFRTYPADQAGLYPNVVMTASEIIP